MARAPRYDANTKAAVTAYAAEHAFAATYARWPEINQATIRQWCSRAHVVTCDGEKMTAALATRRLAWEQRRTQMIHEIGEVAHKALARVDANIEEGNARNAKDYATTMAILVDKAQLLAGGATARTEHVGREEIHAKLDELAARRQRAA